MTPRQKVATGDALLQAAGALLDSQGIESVTLRAVGALAGVSRQAPYKHYQDKQQLLVALATTYVEQISTRVAMAARRVHPDSRVRLSEMCRAYVRFALAHPHRYRLTFAPDISAGADTALASARHSLGVQFVEAIARCQQEGALPGNDPMPLAYALYAACHGVVELVLTGHIKKGPASTDPAGVIAQLLQSLGAVPASPMPPAVVRVHRRGRARREE